MPQLLETKKILIVVRTYPTPSMRGLEYSCTAGLTEDCHWIRLFPVPYRFLDSDQRFAKYQWIQATVSKGSDPRPESRRLKVDTVQVLSTPLPTSSDWKERKEIVYPVRSRSLCDLVRRRDADGCPTLGFFKPSHIDGFDIEPDSPTWTVRQLNALKQGLLFEKGAVVQLEKVPFKFFYEFHCDDPACRGHRLSCTDWEMGQAWRQWRDKYGGNWEERFREKFETQMIHELDTHFYVGTVSDHPNRWIIVGLFYPPLPKSMPLLDGLD
jgi:hypothetical protein